ncbi:MAG TPA: hypothetical protein VI278_16140 [Nitrososphaeraceae archaeon]
MQTIFSMNYAGFGLGTVNIFRKMVGLPEATWNKQEDDKSHLHSSSNNVQQQHHNSKKYPFRFYDINSLAQYNPILSPILANGQRHTPIQILQ